jgi:3-hydroxyisobutyrate dehydrogenase-like beta-hydroxyacid dehydrogenase
MEVAALMEGRAIFIEAAILGAVGATGGKTKILVSGANAPQIEKILCKYGLNVSTFGTKIGGASQFKMIRSVFSKGLETLLIEMMEAGVKAGILEEVWTDISNFMEQMPFDKIGENWINTHPRAAERRYEEMQQVIETLKELGAGTSMAEGSMQVFKASMDRKVGERFPEAPRDYRDVIRFLAE